MAKKNTSRATIGSTKYQKEYINEKIDDLIREPMLPSEILLLHHKKRYTCFTSGYKYKINFCMRPISDISEDVFDTRFRAKRQFRNALTHNTRYEI